MKISSRESSDESVVDEGFASIEEGCKYLRICRASMYLLMEAGEVAYAKFGKSRRIPWRALKDFAARSLVAK
jgi:excisionase family DNA binding protein